MTRANEIELLEITSSHKWIGETGPEDIKTGAQFAVSLEKRLAGHDLPQTTICKYQRSATRHDQEAVLTREWLRQVEIGRPLVPGKLGTQGPGLVCTL